MSRLFDGYGANYGDVVQSSIDFSGLQHDFFMEAKADLLGSVMRDRLGSAHAPRLLDVGCGVAKLHPYLAGLFDRITGVDVSAPCIEEAARRNPANSYAVVGAGKPLPNEQFDVALAVCAIHHVAPCEWESFVADMVRVTRPGGLVCIIEHNPFNPLTRFAVSRCPFDRDAVLLRSGRAEALLNNAGAKSVDSRFFLLLPSKTAVAGKVENLLGALPFGAQYLTCGEI